MARLTVEEIDGVTVATFNDAKILEDQLIQQLGNELLQTAGSTSSGKLVLDFSRVKFMSSAMLGRLVMLRRKCNELKVEVKLCSLADNLKEVFKIVNLHKMFEIADDQEKAIRSFSKKGWFG